MEIHKNLENDQIFKESRMNRNPTNDGYTNPEKEVEIHRGTNRERNDQQTPEL